MEYFWGHSRRFNDYSNYIIKTFGQRVQKVSVNAGFTCPNRDGTKGLGGCAFCNNSTFNPSYCDADSGVVAQIEKGISFFRPKYQTQRYLAYFQAYSNTYGETSHLLSLYRQALEHPLIAGLVLGTRPDCLADDLLDALAGMNEHAYIAIELGAESTLNPTLERINRGHSWEDTVDAVQRIRQRGIAVGMHLILGLPGESRDDLLNHARKVSQIPIQLLKLHQLQIVKGSGFAREYALHPEGFQLYTADDFIELCVDFVELLRPSIVMERFISQAPHHLLVAPQWGLKNHEFVVKVDRLMEQRDTWQGRLFGSE